MKKTKKNPKSRSDTPNNDQLREYEDIESEESDTENLLDKLNEESEESSSEEEVLPVFSESDATSENEISDGDDEDEIGNKISDSDIEGMEDYLPDPKAWGKQKKSYYNADRIIDKDDFLNEEEEEAAKMEEEEARSIQKRLISEIDAADLSLDLLSDVIAEKKDEDKFPENDKIELDFRQMSETEKLKLLKKECPELFVYMDDYKRLMSCLKHYLLPLGRFSCTEILDEKIQEFVKVYRQVIMNYCTNIVFFLLLKARKADTKSHPVTKWITRYRNVLNEMEPIYEQKMKQQIEVILSREFTADEINQKKRKNDSKLKNNKSMKLESKISDSGKPEQKMVTNTIYDPDEDDQFEKYNQEETNSKRPITYEMAKNKGLTPRRKKELRNPRVKHRMKYRKAKIRRKGQIREVRKELQKYGGEISGIKATVIKSIKLKS